jgi:hypothetical protein
MALKPLGYELLKKSHTSLGAMSSVEALASPLQELFAQLRIDTVIDVGANLGQYYEFLRDRIGFTGRIVSFEPHPDLAAQLKKRARADKGKQKLRRRLSSTASLMFPYGRSMQCWLMQAGSTAKSMRRARIWTC